MKVFETLHPGQPPLSDAWYLRAICFGLMQVWEGKEHRLVILVPPRHLKSITVSVAYSAWLLGKDATQKIMVATYGEDLSREHATHARTIVESDWYRRLFPKTRIAARNNRKMEFHTTAGGCRRAVSVDGAITGLGADVIILDDCMKAEDARSTVKRAHLLSWYRNTLLSRLNNKAEAKIISIQQRLHEDDLPAHLIDQGYTLLSLPAIAETEDHIPIGNGVPHHRKVGDLLNPERENEEVLEDIRREMGPVAFQAQYQQDPTVPAGNLVRMEWFGSYDGPPDRHELLKVVQSWDTAMTAAPTSDWTVGTTWGFHRSEYRWYLLDICRTRLDYPDLKRTIVREMRRWTADHVLIEDAGSGKSLQQDYRASGELAPIMIKPQGDKEERFNGCLAEVEAGLFLLPRNAPWLDGFKSEIKAFPNGKYDDQVDSFSQFVTWQLKRWRLLLQERDAEGRPMRPIRHRHRPW
jgi:predicted phage terminase large subunit-like protein